MDVNNEATSFIVNANFCLKGKGGGEGEKRRERGRKGEEERGIREEGGERERERGERKEGRGKRRERRGESLLVIINQVTHWPLFINCLPQWLLWSQTETENQRLTISATLSPMTSLRRGDPKQDATPIPG